LIRDNGNEFYVSFHAKPSILSSSSIVWDIKDFPDSTKGFIKSAMFSAFYKYSIIFFIFIFLVPFLTHTLDKLQRNMPLKLKLQFVLCRSFLTCLSFVLH
jgi:hypothetical protein